jgi:hypothetical protein
MTELWRILHASSFVLIVLLSLSPLALGQDFHYIGVPDDWLSPGPVAAWKYYPWVTPSTISFPVVTTYAYSAPAYSYDIPTYAVPTYPYTVSTYPYTVSTYSYLVYNPRSAAGERWWDYRPNWTRTVEFARNQSSIRVFRGGTWQTP